MRELARSVPSTSPAAAVLRAEADVLASHEAPGLPAVVRCGPVPHDDVDEIELVTAVPPGVPLADRCPLAADEAAAVVLALGTVLLDLAARGIEHDPIAVEQVHLAAGGRPALMHVAGARHAAAAIEPTAADLGALLLRLLPPPVPTRRWRLTADGASAYRTLAHRAADPALGLAVFLDRLRAAAPDARLPRVDAEPGRDQHPPPHRANARVARVVAAVVVGLAAMATLVVGIRAWSAPESVELAAAPDDPPSATPAPADAEAVAVWPRGDCAGEPSAPPTCTASLRVEALTVWSGTRAWRLEGEGDYVLALVDLDCSNDPTVIALDRDNGDVWRLPRTGPGSPMQRLGRASGAVALADPTDGCGTPRATSADGSDVAMLLAPADTNPPPGRGAP